MQQLDPKSVWMFFISSIMRWLLFIAFIGVYFVIFLTRSNQTEGLSLVFLNWLWLIVPALLILFFVWAKLSYHFYRYQLSEYGFKKESGVIYKRYVTIPYDRIQNVDIYRGILARILGLSDLQIQTAGFSGAGAAGIGAKGRLPGLSQEIAEQLRDQLIQLARQSKNQGL